MSGRIAVGVSGTGSNLRALHGAAERGELGGEIVLVFADRACPALEWAAEQGIETALVPGGDDATLAATLAAWPRTRRPRRLHADPRPGRAGRVPRADPQHPPVAAAGVSGRACRGRCPGPRRHRDRLHGPSRRRHARWRPDRGPGGGGDPARRRRRAPACRIRDVEHRLLPSGGGAPARGRPGVSGRMGVTCSSISSEPMRPCRRRAGPCCPSRTRPAWSPSRRVSSGPGSSSSPPAGPRERYARPGFRDRCRGRDRVPGDARRPGQDPPPTGPRRHPGRSPAGRSPPPAPGRGDRPVRAGRRQPLSVRRRRRAAWDLARRAGRGDRHRRPGPGPGGGQEPRQRRDRHLARPL